MVEGDQTGDRVVKLVVRLVVEVLEEEEYLFQEKRGRVPVQIPLALKGANLFLLVLGLQGQVKALEILVMSFCFLPLMLQLKKNWVTLPSMICWSLAACMLFSVKPTGTKTRNATFSSK